jgi:mono/diheme cytochrome c family protein
MHEDDRMKKLAVALTIVGLVAIAAFHQNASASDKNAKQIARGEYLVKGLAGCGDCHTPMNEKGEAVMDEWLHGTKLFFGPLVPIPNWASSSVNIAGLPGWDEKKAVELLMTGLSPNGQPPRPPMPQYRMNKEDAEAVVAYLKSLPAPKQ